MVDKQEATALERMAQAGNGTMLFGYHPDSGKLGWVPASIASGTKPWGGRRWRKDSSSPVGEAYGDIDFLKALPALIGLGCYLVQNDHSRVKLAADNHYKTVDGSAVRLDGSMGHYHWGWNVPFYYSMWEDEQYTYEVISLHEIEDHWNYKIPVASCSASGNATMDRTNGRLVSYCNKAAQYRGGNNDAAKDSAFNSQLGLCATSLSTEAFEEAARKNGDRWTSGFHGFIFIRAALFRIIMGTRNVQATFVATRDSNGLHQGGLGYGCSYPSDWGGPWGYHPFLPMDAGAQLGDFTGVFSHTIKGSDGNNLAITDIPSFYGLKNFYKYMWLMSGSMFGYDLADGTMDMYVNPKLTKDKVAMTTAAMTKAGTAVGVVDNWTGIKEIGHHLLCPIPLKVEGTTSTYYCDSFYKGSNSAGSRLCLFGGGAHSGVNAGLLCLSADRGLSSAYAYCGALLCEAAEDWDTEAYWVE